MGGREDILEMNFNGVRQFLKAKLLEFQFRIQEMEGVEWFKDHLYTFDDRWGRTSPHDFFWTAYSSATAFDEYRMFLDIVLKSSNYKSGFAFSLKIVDHFIQNNEVFMYNSRRSQYLFDRSYLDLSFDICLNIFHRDLIRQLYYKWVVPGNLTSSFVKNSRKRALLNYMLFKLPDCYEHWEWSWDVGFRDKYWEQSDRFRQGLVVMSGLRLPNELEREVLGWLGCL